MQRKLSLFQYGSQFDPTGPTRHSPSDWIETSLNPFGTTTTEITNTTDQSTTTMNENRSQSSETLANTHGLFEDFPGLSEGSDDVEPHLPDMGDDRNILAFDDPDSLLTAICDHFSFYLETTGTALPAQWSIQDPVR